MAQESDMSLTPWLFLQGANRESLRPAGCWVNSCEKGGVKSLRTSGWQGSEVQEQRDPCHPERGKENKQANVNKEIHRKLGSDCGAGQDKKTSDNEENSLVSMEPWYRSPQSRVSDKDGGQEHTVRMFGSKVAGLHQASPQEQRYTENSWQNGLPDTMYSSAVPHQTLSASLRSVKGCKRLDSPS